MIGLMKVELGIKTIITFSVLRAKAYSYLVDDRQKKRKRKNEQKSVT